jgi:hypothetical protein
MAIASRGPRFAELSTFGRNFEGPGPHSGSKLKTFGTVWPEVCQKHHSLLDTPMREDRHRINHEGMAGDLRATGVARSGSGSRTIA